MTAPQRDCESLERALDRLIDQRAAGYVDARTFKREAAVLRRQIALARSAQAPRGRA